MKLIIRLLVLISPLTTYAQAWQWGYGAGNDDTYWYNSSSAVVADRAGNAYIAGWFYGDSMVFGTSTLYNNSYNPAVLYNLFLVKYDSIGNVVWGWTPPSGYSSYATALATDSAGYIYMTGSFYGDQLIFGTDTLRNDTSSSFYPNSASMFLAKFDGSGNVVWAKQPLTSYQDGVFAQSIGVNNAGNIFAGGMILNTPWVVFGTDTLSDTSVTNSEVFLAKFDNTGTAIWGRQSTNGDPYTSIGQLATDTSGNAYMQVYFREQLSLGSGIITDHEPYFNYSTCIAKFNGSGTLIWSMTPKPNSSFQSLATDNYGNLFVAGNFYDTLILGAQTLVDNFPEVVIIDTFSVNDTIRHSSAYIANYDSLLNINWAYDLQGLITKNTLTTDDSGNVYFAGSFDTASPFCDSLISGHYSFANSGQDDIVIGKIDHTGDLKWMATAGGNGNDDPDGIAVDMWGDAYITGSFTSSSLMFNMNDLSYTGLQSLFLAKFNAGIPAGIPTIPPDNANMTLYPDPASNSVCISTPGKVVASVSIFNVLGAFVYQQLYNTDLVTIDISKFQPGIYFVRVNNSTTLKFIKE